MGTPLNPASDRVATSTNPSLSEHFRAVATSLRVKHRGLADTHCIAGAGIKLHFGSEFLRSQISPALRHLATANASESELSIFIHDLSTAPFADGLFGAVHDSVGETDIWLIDDPELTLILQRHGNVISALDWRNKSSYWLVPDAASIPYLERAAPLRALLTLSLGRRGRYLVHAAAVGNERGGALILGRGGAGKSTAAIACLAAGMEYVSDDHCLVSSEEVPIVHSIYGTAKLSLSDIDRFPFLASVADMAGRPAEEKVVFFLDSLSGVRLSRSFPLRAILLARIANTRQSRLRKMSAADGFKAIAPSCALHLPAARRRALECFNSLVRRLPAYMLELGTEFDSIPNTIREVLDY